MQAILGAALKGGVLGPFRSENWYTLFFYAHFGLEPGMVYRAATGAYQRSYRFNSKWITMKYMEICEFETRSNLSNDDIISFPICLKPKV